MMEGSRKKANPMPEMVCTVAFSEKTSVRARVSNKSSFPFEQERVQWESSAKEKQSGLRGMKHDYLVEELWRDGKKNTETMARGVRLESSTIQSTITSPLYISSSRL